MSILHGAASFSDIARAQLALRQRGLIPGSVPKLSFRAWAERHHPQFIWYRHLHLFSNVLDRLFAGEHSMVMTFWPPRHGKSECVSRLLPAYCLYRWPTNTYALASYGAELATDLSRAARDNFVGVLDPDQQSAAVWKTMQGGGMWSCGVGGAATGKGYDGGGIDDPIKDAAESLSEAVRRRNQDWLDSVWMLRREPGAWNLWTMTRWHHADLAGYYLSGWAKNVPTHIVHFPAIAEDPDEVRALYPDYVTVEPDFRRVGEALCPERFNLDTLRVMKQGMTDYWWSSLYQQRPSVRGGSKFPRQLVKIIEVLPAEPPAVKIRYWDKAGTEGAGAYTAGVLLHLYRNGRIIVADVRRAQLASKAREELLKLTAQLDGRETYIRVETEPGATGKESTENTIRNLRGYRIEGDRPTGDKELRADPIAGQWQGGNVELLKAPWNKEYLDEAETFPTGTYKDQVDATSGAYNLGVEIMGTRVLVGPVTGPIYPVFSV